MVSTLFQCVFNVVFTWLQLGLRWIRSGYVGLGGVGLSWVTLG
jgi:hypothetical protein